MVHTGIFWLFENAESVSPNAGNVNRINSKKGKASVAEIFGLAINYIPYTLERSGYLQKFILTSPLGYKIIYALPESGYLRFGAKDYN